MEWRHMKEEKITIEQMIEELSESTNGFGNGHAQFMITNIQEDEFNDLISELYEFSQKNPICDLRVAEDKMSLRADIHTEYYERDWLVKLSRQHVLSFFYWNDCWDNQTFMVVLESGSEVKNCYNAKILYDEFNGLYDSELTFNIEVEVRDMETGTTMVIGGGCLNERQREELYLLCLRSSTEPPIKIK